MRDSKENVTDRELDLLEYESTDDYDLHALYCEYYEWLAAPHPHRSKEVRTLYTNKLHHINITLAKRYKDEI
jgi:hypothetical protein